MAEYSTSKNSSQYIRGVTSRKPITANNRQCKKLSLQKNRHCKKPSQQKTLTLLGHASVQKTVSAKNRDPSRPRQVSDISLLFRLGRVAAKYRLSPAIPSNTIFTARASFIARAVGECDREGKKYDIALEQA